MINFVVKYIKYASFQKIISNYHSPQKTSGVENFAIPELNIYFLDCRTSNNCCLPEVPFGLVLRINLQQGQCIPSHFMKTSHLEHRLLPNA